MVMDMSTTHPNINSHASLLQLNFSKFLRGKNVLFSLKMLYENYFVFLIMNPLCCNENSGVSLSDLAILKLQHEFGKFVSQPLQHQLAHIVEII